VYPELTLFVNGKAHQVAVDPQTPLLYVLRNDLGLKSPKYGCASEQCNACKVLVDGADVPSCKLPVGHVQGLEVVTIEGLGTPEALHPLQEAFIQEGAIQCGYCVSGMIIAAQGLLNRTRYPTDDDIRAELAGNLCRCGVYDRVRRAIKLRIGRPDPEPIYQVIDSALESGLSAPQPPGKLPLSIRRTPELDSWVRINLDGTITIFTGKVEIGQGIKTAVAQIAAEELDVSLDRIRVQMADTGRSPDEGLTAGSTSLEVTGAAVRQAAAQARAILLSIAYEYLNSDTPMEDLVVSDGVIADPLSGRQTDYWSLQGGRLFGRSIHSDIRPKEPADHQIVGQAAIRLDLLAKVTGQPYFVHDLEMDGMVHGRVVRPPGYDAHLISTGLFTDLEVPGIIKVVQNGDFLAVIAGREDQAVKAKELLEASSIWENKTDLPPAESLDQLLLSQPSQSYLIKNGTAVDDPIPDIAKQIEDSRSLQASYSRPYHMHGSLGPSAAVAQLKEGKLTIWSHSQGIFPLRSSIAHVLAMDPDDIRIIHEEGAGSYGHNGADDVALDAALLARAVPGTPVSVKWSRSDEHRWEPYGAAMVVKLGAALDESGAISAWNHEVWSYPHTARLSPTGKISGLLAAWHLASPLEKPQPQFFKGAHFGQYRNADPVYSLPQKRVVAHFVPGSPLRTSFLRSLGAYANVFAIESFIDELALAAGADPVQFRLALLADHRAIDVIEAAAEKAGWGGKQVSSGTGHGRGFAFARFKNAGCYTAVIVDLQVDVTSGQIQLNHVVIAADAGQIVNPDGLSNQLEGGFVQSASWTLTEEVTFDRQGITSVDWDSYPVLRFSGSPLIETVLINQPGLSFFGVGEVAQGPAAAAITNAIFDAVGVRVRDLPATPIKLLKELST
jgi:CO/xanthine dehydrogenase Mo-binding subunit/aerobic-type carbon monoxide dehydrogenase small subunit (CoxS/CutS family)